MWGIIAANVVVFVLWQLPALAPIMQRHAQLALPPWVAQTHTMLTMTFSHQKFEHIALHVIALNAFGPSVAAAMGPIQFVAFYLSAGLASSAASVLGRCALLAGSIICLATHCKCHVTLLAALEVGQLGDLHACLADI